MERLLLRKMYPKPQDKGTLALFSRPMWLSPGNWVGSSSREHPHVKENHAGKAACCKRWDHSDLDPENGNDGSHRKQECPGIDARKLRCIERKQESAHRLNFAEQRVDAEPDREVENDADDSR